MELVKPDYKVPLMTEIQCIPWNGYSAISTFSGCGGSSLGYRMAGFKVLWASEFIDEARKSYAANKADYTIIDGRDIRNVTAGEILRAINMHPGELDLLDGSPPCASFSTAGKREAGWGTVKKYSDKAQRTDDLFFEYIRLLHDLQPKTFVAENVSGLIKGAAKGYFLEILAGLKNCGYKVACKVLDAQWLGVPQARQRTIFIGVRNDFGVEPAHPKPLPYRYSVRDALPSLLHEKRGGKPENWQKTSLPSSTIVASGARVSRTGYLSGGAFFRDWDNAVRRLTIEELRRICAFPDDFILTGTYAQQWERLGRAVPPVMMSHIAATVRDEILAKVR